MSTDRQRLETKLRSKRGVTTRTWGVIVAEPAKLLFDRRSLFYDRQGNRLHNYLDVFEREILAEDPSPA